LLRLDWLLVALALISRIARAELATAAALMTARHFISIMQVLLQ
jgi:hypothetical protein